MSSARATFVSVAADVTPSAKDEYGNDGGVVAPEPGC
jgi:hypothetical protein